MVETFLGKAPTIDDGAWVHESAVVMGDVYLARGVTIWPTAVLRGDMGPIRIGEESNIQDGAVCHDTSGLSETLVGRRVTVGHRAVLHGCVVEDRCLIGMGAIVLDNAVVGEGSIIGAGAVVTAGRIIPPGSLVLGVPGKVIRPVTDADKEQIEEGWQSYLAKLKEIRRELG
jgi:carbonic anhydrase/acetyltransferase-like protein (isoleucine patch superfamily)